jgi:hypothetical protein
MSSGSFFTGCVARDLAQCSANLIKEDDVSQLRVLRPAAHAYKTARVELLRWLRTDVTKISRLGWCRGEQAHGWFVPMTAVDAYDAP